MIGNGQNSYFDIVFNKFYREFSPELKRFNINVSKHYIESIVKDLFLEDVKNISEHRFKSLTALDMENYCERCLRRKDKGVYSKTCWIGYLYINIISSEQWEELFGSKARILDDDELKRIMDKARLKNRDYLLLLMMLRLGVDHKELALIKWSDFFAVGDDWYVNIVKERKTIRQLFVPVDIIDLLREFSKKFVIGKSQVSVFGITKGYINTIVKRYGWISSLTLVRTGIAKGYVKEVNLMEV